MSTSFVDREQLNSVLPAIPAQEIRLPHESLGGAPTVSHELVQIGPATEVVIGEIVEDEAEPTPLTEAELIFECVRKAQETRALLEKTLKSEFIEFNAAEAELIGNESRLIHHASEQQNREERIVILTAAIVDEVADQRVLHGRVADLDQAIEPVEASKQYYIGERQKLQAILAQHKEEPGSIPAHVLMDASNEIHELNVDGNPGGLLRAEIEKRQAEIDALNVKRMQLTEIEIPSSIVKIVDLREYIETADVVIELLENEIEDLENRSAFLRQLHDDRSVWFESARKMIDAVRERRKASQQMVVTQQPGAQE
jgi:hypothetical protein